MKNFVEGRKSVFKELEQNLSTGDRTIWLHAASLGEYEQGVPVLEQLKASFPDYKIVVSFFSPSGYEVKKNNPLADSTVYLPLDTKKDAHRFVDLAQPKLALFVKYEVWPNFLKVLGNKNIPTLLISANFRKDQIYFKSYGGFMRNALKSFDHIFVQNEESKNILLLHNLDRVSISGDTRFDRVSKQLNMDNKLDFMENFKGGNLCLIGGSTWPEDEEFLIDFIDKAPDSVKIVLAPHQIKTPQIESFRKRLSKNTILYSEINEKDPKNFSVLIIDTVGLLTKVYSYGDIAYVGGAAGNTGLHNILEPAAFGMPVVIGPNHQNFPEAKDLKDNDGLFSVSTAAECTAILTKLTEDEDYRNKIGSNAKRFIQKNTGATRIIIEYITTNHLL